MYLQVQIINAAMYLFNFIYYCVNLNILYEIVAVYKYICIAIELLYDQLLRKYVLNLCTLIFILLA